MLDSGMLFAQVLFQKGRERFILIQVLYWNPAHFLFYALCHAVAVKLLRPSGLHQEIEAEFVTVHTLQRSTILIEEVFVDHSQTVYLIMHTGFFKLFPKHGCFCCFTVVHTAADGIEIIICFITAISYGPVAWPLTARW